MTEYILDEFPPLLIDMKDAGNFIVELSPLNYFTTLIFDRQAFPGLLSFRPGTGTGATV